MKKHIELSNHRDCTFTYWDLQKKDENRKPIWVNAEESIGEVENKVHEVSMYVQIPDTNTYMCVGFTRGDIIKLYEAISEIEAEVLKPTFIDC